MKIEVPGCSFASAMIGCALFYTVIFPVLAEGDDREQGTQPEGTFLNLINWIGNVIAPVGAGGAALMAIGSFAMGRGFGKWVFTAIGLLMVSGVTRLLEYWIAQGTAGVT